MRQEKVVAFTADSNGKTAVDTVQNFFSTNIKIKVAYSGCKRSVKWQVL